MSNELSGELLRRMAGHHKATGQCVEAVTFGPRGSRFLVAGEAPKSDEHETIWFDRCRVCGHPIAKAPL